MYVRKSNDGETLAQYGDGGHGRWASGVKGGFRLRLQVPIAASSLIHARHERIDGGCTV